VKFELPKLPYDYTALEPFISGQTLELHYSKHHQGYMTKLEKAIGGSDLGKKSLEHIVRNSTGDVFNNAAQVWNHSFYWHGMTPGDSKEPSRELAARIKRDLGSLDAFEREFAQIASGEFGSGWAWLIENGDGKLEILSTHDAGNPLSDGAKPLLTLDVWEHAYYLDYQNDRGAYIEALLDHLIDCRFVESNLGATSELRRAATA